MGSVAGKKPGGGDKAESSSRKETGGQRYGSSIIGHASMGVVETYRKERHRGGRAGREAKAPRGGGKPK